jgi:HEAT repeat protein
MVQAKKYPAGKAFFQVGASALFFMLLLPGAKAPYDPPADGVEQLLSNGSPQVRALAAEVARYRADGRKYLPPLARALSDRDERVREEAHRSLVLLSGEDLGAPPDADAVRRWREKYP